MRKVGRVKGLKESDTSEGQPLCPKCLEPFSPMEYYCRKCGGPVGKLTPYIPFVNIPFNYSVFGKMWQKVWYEESGLPMKVACLFFMVLFVPIMFLGLPFLIWDKFHKRRDKV